MRQQKYTKQRLKYWLEIGGLYAGIVMVVVIFFQWREMRYERILDERAWIGINGAGLLLPYNADHVGMYIEIMNTGKTPAMIEKICINIGTSDAPFTKTNWFFETNFVGMAVSPGGKSPLWMPEQKPIGEENFALLHERKQQHYFYVKIRYRDIFNNVRHTDAGFIVTGKEEDMGPGRIFNAFGSGRMD